LHQLLQLKGERMPHYSTWSRVLGHGVEPEEVERVVGQFFAQATRMPYRKRDSIQLAIDGKTLRGTIPLGETEGVHLLAVYQPKAGVVLAQMNVKHKGRAHHVCSHITQSDRFARGAGQWRRDV
jgi:hypothetical protein